MKQLKHFLLMAAMLMCSFAASAHDFVKNGIYYKLPESIDFANLTVSVTYMGGGYSDYTNEYRGHVEIPSTVTYRGTTYRVVHIGAYAFACCDALTSVVIPSTVTSIGNGAFADCSSLISINIPKDVTSIGEGAFSYCGSLSSIVVAGGNRVYDSRDNCNAIIETSNNTLIRGCGKTIIPASVTSIGEDAFSGCSSLTSINIPASVTSIGENAFCECSSLTSINIPASVTSIGRGAFRSCSSLASVVLSKNLRRIKELTFYECSSLSSITIPNGVTHIEQEAFHYCSSLTSITIPESVTRIGAYAFDGCRSLTSVKCPQKFKYLFPKAGFDKVGDFVFYDNTLIGYVGNSSDVVLPKSFDGKNYDVGKRAFENSLVKVTSISIPEGVTNIADGTFSGCGDLKRVTINCAHVGDWFSGNNSIKKIVLGERVASIDNGAFENCSGLEHVTISCAHVGKWFRQNSSIKEITLGESVKSIADGAFDSCSGLIAIRINDIASWCKIDFGNQYSNPLRYASKLYLNGKLVTELTIPNTVTAIKDYAFWGCNLTSITLPESVTSIGREAFCECSSLTSVTLPKSVTSIGERAFHKCGKLTSVVLPENLRSIGYATFQNCSSLTSVTIPESVTNIGDYAFGYCSSLASVTVPQGVTSIGCNAFIWCRSLTSITIPKERAKLLNGAFGDENVKLKVNGKTRTIKPQKTSQNSIKGNLENRIKEWASPSMPSGVGVGSVVVGSAVGSVN